MTVASLASARPLLRLGGAAPGGLRLPDAAPTPGTMYAPRGVWTSTVSPYCSSNWAKTFSISAQAGQPGDISSTSVGFLGASSALETDGSRKNTTTIAVKKRNILERLISNPSRVYFGLLNILVL